jgi:alpha-L-fucosidase 2
MSKSRSALFRGRHFADEIVVLCVRWYLRFSLSYRDLEEIMTERYLAVDHTTVWRWVQRYAPELNRRGVARTEAQGPFLATKLMQSRPRLGKRMRIPIHRFSPIVAVCVGCWAQVSASGQACPAPTGDPAGNYMVAGAIGNVKYSGSLTLDAYAPAGPPRPAAVLIHGGNGNKSTHLTQLFEVLEHAGFAWFSIDYRNLEDVRAAVRYIECPGRFNIGSRLVLIAEDAGATPAVRVAGEAKANGVVLFGARFDAHPPAPGAPLLIFHGTNDEEVPPREIEGLCAKWPRCRFVPVVDGIHNFENWHADQWEWKEDLGAWLRGDQRGLWKDITYARPGGRDLRMDAFIPEGAGPFPGVVIVHGGGWEAGDKTTYISPVFGPLAQAGFAWFSVDYRLTPYVHNADKLDDLRAAIRYVRNHAERFHVAPDHIAVLGESASGQMATQIASQPCPQCEVQAVVSFYGVYDFTRWADDPSGRPMLDRIFGDWDTAILERYSPLFHAHRDMPPVLLIQGTQDELYAGTLAYAERLKQCGARHALVVLEGAPHGMENWAGHSEWEFYKQRLVDWLQENLSRK